MCAVGMMEDSTAAQLETVERQSMELCLNAVATFCTIAVLQVFIP